MGLSREEVEKISEATKHRVLADAAEALFNRVDKATDPIVNTWVADIVAGAKADGLSEIATVDAVAYTDIRARLEAALTTLEAGRIICKHFGAPAELNKRWDDAMIELYAATAILFCAQADFLHD